jgi:hypothetical protein
MFNLFHKPPKKRLVRGMCGVRFRNVLHEEAREVEALSLLFA